jgi:hypothetical protein
MHLGGYYEQNVDDGDWIYCSGHNTLYRDLADLCGPERGDGEPGNYIRHIGRLKMRLEYIAIGFILMVVVLLVIISLLSGAVPGMNFIFGLVNK